MFGQSGENTVLGMIFTAFLWDLVLGSSLSLFRWGICNKGAHLPLCCICLGWQSRPKEQSFLDFCFYLWCFALSLSLSHFLLWTCFYGKVISCIWTSWCSIVRQEKFCLLLTSLWYNENEMLHLGAQGALNHVNNGSKRLLLELGT